MSPSIESLCFNLYTLFIIFFYVSAPYACKIKHVTSKYVVASHRFFFKKKIHFTFLSRVSKSPTHHPKFEHCQITQRTLPFPSSPLFYGFKGGKKQGVGRLSRKQSPDNFDVLLGEQFLIPHVFHLVAQHVQIHCR